MVRQIRAGHICVKVGGDCLKYLKWGWNRTEWRGHKFSENEGQAGSRGGARTPLQTMPTVKT